MTVALVTGGHGFVGSHLGRLLVGEGWSVISLGRSEAEAEHGERYVRADVTIQDEIDAVLDATRPDVIFHLAAAFGQSVSDPIELVREAVTGTQAVCAGLRRVGLHSRLVLAGSSAQYAPVGPSRSPLTESDLCQPVNAYGYAKAAAEATAFALADGDAFELLAVRAFNHVGPGEPTTTVAGALAARIRSVVDGHADRLSVADLGVVRDFTDVRDIAAGYLALATSGVPGRIYNLCSGRGRTVGDVLDGLLVAAGLDRSIVDVLAGSGGAVPWQVGSAARVEADTGWSAKIDLDDSLADLLASSHGGPAFRASARRTLKESTSGG